MPESLHSTVISGGFDVGSGVIPLVVPTTRMERDRFGRWTTYGTAGLSAHEDRIAASVSAMAEGRSSDETDIATALFGAVPGVQHHETLGFYTGLHAGHVIEGTYRSEGSSGGLTTWLLVELLERGEIDGVLHAHPTFSRGGSLFEYRVASSAREIREGAKSRYYPMEAGSALRDCMTHHQRIAVVGIPSILTELRLLARADPRVGRAVTHFIGLVCGHQKSARYADALAWQCGIRPGETSYIDFRAKRPTGAASDYDTEVHGLIEGRETVVRRRTKDLFGTDWGHGFFKVRFSDFTDDAFNETADITFGDAWLPQYDRDPRGTNIIVARDPHLQAILAEGVREGRIRLDDLSPTQVVDSQRGLVRHTRDELPHRLMRMEQLGRWRPPTRTAAASHLSASRGRVQDLRTRIAEESHERFDNAVTKGDWAAFQRPMSRLVAKYSAAYRRMRLVALATAVVRRLRR